MLRDITTNENDSNRRASDDTIETWNLMEVSANG